MKITHLLKVTLLGLMLSLLAGCQSAPKGLTPGANRRAQGAGLLSDR